MNRILLIFILTFSFQSLTKADDIRDIEIDGMRLGESLLNYYSKVEIKSNKVEYFKDEKQYYVTFYNKNLIKFDDFEIYLKTDDKNYTIKSINAGLYPKNLNECMEEKKILVDEISSSIEVEFQDSNYTHNYYKNTFINGVIAFLDGGYISIECMFFDKKDKNKFPLLVDNLSVSLTSDEVDEWIASGYK